jgi:hypothetical protein
MKFRHTEASKVRIRHGIAVARQKAIEERGAYFTKEVVDSIKAKLAERMTPERRERFSQETRVARAKANETRQRNADAFAKEHASVISKLQRDGLGLTEIATKMNEAGHTSRRGGPWTDQTVRQILKRLKKITIKDIRSEVVSDIEVKGPRFIGWRNT